MVRKSYYQNIYKVGLVWYGMEKKKCDYCDKVIEGFSKKQIDVLMMQHKLARHSDKVEIKEKKK